MTQRCFYRFGLLCLQFWYWRLISANVCFEELARYRTGGSPGPMTDQVERDGRTYLFLVNNYVVLHLMDVTNSSSPFIVFSFYPWRDSDTPNFVMYDLEVTTDQQRLLAVGAQNLVMFNIENLLSPKFTSKITFGSLVNQITLTSDPNIVYVSCGYSGSDFTSIISLHNNNPVVLNYVTGRSKIVVPRSNKDVIFSQDGRYTVNSPCGALVRTYWPTAVDQIYDLAISNDGSILFVANARGISVMNVTNTNDLRVLLNVTSCLYSKTLTYWQSTDGLHKRLLVDMCGNAFTIFNVDNPTAPIKIGMFPNVSVLTGGDQILLNADASRLYVSLSFTRTWYPFSIYAVSNMSGSPQIQLAGVSLTGGGVSSMVFEPSKSTLFVQAEANLGIFPFSNHNLDQLTQQTPQNFPGISLLVDNVNKDVLYQTDGQGSLRKLNISDPNHLKLMDEYEGDFLDDWISSIIFSYHNPKIAYGFGASGFAVVNFTEFPLLSFNPVFDFIGTGTFLTFDVVENRTLAFIVTSVSGFSILNWSSTDDPSIYETPGQARDVLVLNDNIVLLCDHTALLIVNITNIQNITEISRITPDIGGYLFSVAIDQTKKYLFLNQYSGGLKIVDISDIQSPNVLGVYESIDSLNMVLPHPTLSNYVFVGTASNGFFHLKINYDCANSTATSSNIDSGSSSSTIIIAAAAAGGGFLLILVVVLAFLLVRKRKMSLDRSSTYQASPQVEEKQAIELQLASLPPSYQALTPSVSKNSSINSSGNYNALSLSNNGSPYMSSSPSKKTFQPKGDWDIDYAQIRLTRELGRGGFGVVYQGKWRHQQVAVKKLIKQDMNNIVEFQKEVSLMQRLRPHKNVLQLLGSCSDPLCIVTEFVDGGNVRTFLTSNTNTIELKQLYSIALQTCAGMAHLASEGVVHRDLACRNLLLTKYGEVKISDFGMSRFCDPDDTNVTKTDIGPLKWMAPESITKRLYSTKSDVWAFGVTVIELFTRGEPYPDMTGVEVIVKVAANELKPEIPANCHPKLMAALKRCFAFEPQQRPTFDQLYSELEPLQDSYG